MKNDFFKVLKEKTTKVPSNKLDSVILEMGAAKLEAKSTRAMPWFWALGSGVVAMSFFIWMQTSELNHSGQMLAESPEMLMIMDDVELLVEVSQYSEEDWNIVMNGES